MTWIVIAVLAVTLACMFYAEESQRKMRLYKKQRDELIIQISKLKMLAIEKNTK